MANLERFKDWLDQHDGWNSFPQFTWVPEVIGWCNPEQGALLNFLVSRCLEEGETYLEIGSFCGKSLAAALHNNDATAHVIDPQNLKVSTADTEYFWNRTVDGYGIRHRVTLHQALSHLFQGDLPSVGVFYADGDHDAGHTYECLKQFAPYLSDRAIIIADDYNIAGDVVTSTGPYVQRPFPGYDKSESPVKDDVDRWIADTPQATMLAVSPWHTSQAYILYER